MRRDIDAVYSVQNGVYGANVLLEGAKNRRRAAEDVDALRRGYGEQRRHGSRKHERSTVNALVVPSAAVISYAEATYLVVDDNMRTGTEAAASSQAVCQGADQHVNLRCLRDPVSK